MADASLTLLSRADLNTITDTATGRVALAVKNTANATTATIEQGYTGVMNVTSLAAGIVAGTVELWRDRNNVTLNLINVRATADETLALFGASNLLPAGFRSSSTVSGHGGTVATTATTYSRRLNWDRNGNVNIYNVTAAETLNGAFTITSASPWPTALIGASTSTIGWV